jgi:hypothetical protein
VGVKRIVRNHPKSTYCGLGQQPDRQGSIDKHREIWISIIREYRDSFLFGRPGQGPVVHNRDELFRLLLAATYNIAMTSSYLVELRQMRPSDYNPDRIIWDTVNAVISERFGPAAR